MQSEIVVAIISSVTSIIVTLIAGYFVIKPKGSKPSKTKPERRAPFWDSLSDTIFIVFGVSFDKDKLTKEHSTLSLRDLEATEAIITFLARNYPKKTIVPLVAATAGWNTLLKRDADADLIIIGGFVVNKEFAELQSIFQTNFRLKMGRLCRCKEQRVYHIGLRGYSQEEIVALHKQPQVVENLPSQQIYRDYAFVCNIRLPLYGSKRRVIAIAGVRGYGTLGAASYLTKTEYEDLGSKFLRKHLKQSDSLEMVITTEVKNEMVDNTKVIEAIQNEKFSGSGGDLWESGGDLWERCDLGILCSQCTFGENLSAVKSSRQ